MTTIGTQAPKQEEIQGAVSLTMQQKVIGVLLLLFYLVMIGVTIATSSFVESRGIFERTSDLF